MATIGRMNRPLRPMPGAMPNKTMKAATPQPGVPVPKLVSGAAKVVAAALGRAPKSGNVTTAVSGAGTRNTSVGPGRPPMMTIPVTRGAMPRKVFANPKSAVPMRPRAVGANRVNPTVFDRLTRGRILQRGTR